AGRSCACSAPWRQEQLWASGSLPSSLSRPPRGLVRKSRMIRDSRSKRSSTRNFQTTRRSSASCVRANARWEIANAAIAACARTAEEPTTRWCTRGYARRTLIPLRRSRCSTTCRGRSLSRWPRPAATSTASFARTGTSPRCVQSRFRPSTLPQNWLPSWPNSATARPLRTPTANRWSSASTCCTHDVSKKTTAYEMDAVKIDLKAFSESYYKDVVVGELKPVLDSLVTLRKMNKWTEIVYLVVPTLNDGDAEFRALARWIKTNLGVDVPIHFTQFHPQYLLKNLPITPVPTLERAKAIADAEGLHYVYIGNVPGHPAQN